MNEIKVILDKVATALSTVPGIQSVDGIFAAVGTDSKSACTKLRYLINEVKKLLTADQTEHVTGTLDNLSNSKNR